MQISHFEENVADEVVTKITLVNNEILKKGMEEKSYDDKGW